MLGVRPCVNDPLAVFLEVLVGDNPPNRLPGAKGELAANGALLLLSSETWPPNMEGWSCCGAWKREEGENEVPPSSGLETCNGGKEKHTL